MFKNLAKNDKPDLSCIASPKGEMKSTFSWTNPFKSTTSSILCFGEPTLGKPNKETEFFITIHITFGDSVVHTETTFSVPRSSSETNRVSDCHFSLVTTPSSRRILDKPKIEVTNVLIHHVGKNGEHSYGVNFIYEYSSKMHIKSNQHMGILHALIKPNQHMGILHIFSNSVTETFNNVLSPSEVEWGDPKREPTKHGPNYTSSVRMHAHGS